MGRHRKYTIEIGRVYVSWIVESYVGIKRYKKGGQIHRWKCRCLGCGKSAIRLSSNIYGGESKTKCHSCLSVPDSAISRAFRTYMRQAKIRGLDFDIPKDRFKELILLDCYYCGLPPEVNSYSEEAKIKVPMNGLDRVNSDLPYTETNVRPCCKMCNLAKLDYPEHVFLNWIHRVADFQKNQIESDWLSDIGGEE